MLKKALLLVLVALPNIVLAQEDTKVTTDTSVIETKYFDYLNYVLVSNTLKKVNKTYSAEYYFKPRRLKEKGVYINNHSVGIWKKYSPGGKLIRKIDHDKGLILYYDKKAYPLYSYILSKKLLCDSVIKSIYSADFFDKYIIWNIDGSSYSANDISGDWNDDNIGLKPDKFLFRYNIRIDNKVYNEMLELSMDQKGNIISDPDSKGFEKLPGNSSKTFTISTDKAIQLAKRNGLVETVPNKAEALLYWEKLNDNAVYNGVFRFYAIIKTTTIKDIHPKGRSTIIDKYDVYVFNPWTSAFIGKKKMKTYRGWEKGSGGSTGLQPDN